jgi:hypothetical protein
LRVRGRGEEEKGVDEEVFMSLKDTVPENTADIGM